MAAHAAITLCLVRRGESAWEDEGRMHGSTDLPLSHASRSRVAEDLALLVGSSPAVVHHPPDEAAAETAKALARRTGAKTRAWDVLAEPNFGLLEGLTAQTFAERYPSRERQWEDDIVSLMPPEGEPMPLARERILRAVHRIVRRARAREIGLVLGPLGLGFIRAWLSGRPADQARALVQARPRIEQYLVSRARLPVLEAAIGGHPG